MFFDALTVSRFYRKSSESRLFLWILAEITELFRYEACLIDDFFDLSFFYEALVGEFAALSFFWDPLGLNLIESIESSLYIDEFLFISPSNTNDGLIVKFSLTFFAVYFFEPDLDKFS